MKIDTDARFAEDLQHEEQEHLRAQEAADERFARSPMDEEERANDGIDGIRSQGCQMTDSDSMFGGRVLGRRHWNSSPKTASGTLGLFKDMLSDTHVSYTLCTFMNHICTKLFDDKAIIGGTVIEMAETRMKEKLRRQITRTMV